MKSEELVKDLRKKATAIYLATESTVADDIAKTMHQAADRIEELDRLFSLLADRNVSRVKHRHPDDDTTPLPPANK